ncbi:MAG: DUF2334 domain-containing protein [Bacillota bacterium]|nr:DUF2334 domain-containing protein [Bacillota bacterium]
MGEVIKKRFGLNEAGDALKRVEVNNINIYFEGRLLKDCSIFRIGNRYIIPLKQVVEMLKGTIHMFINKALINIDGQRLVINLNSKKYKSIIIKNQWYLSIIDIVNIFSMKIRWNYKNSTIKLFMRREKIEKRELIIKRKKALIRFEDFTLGNPYDDAKCLEKFRIMIDYLYCKGIPFHIAWIPRFMNPMEHIDNDIVRDYSIFNADFLFTLDYALSKNGIIGLHGYTHQFGNEISGDGTEFDDNTNNDEESIRDRIKRSINTARALGLEYKFFESPHYASNSFQQSIMEQYFKYMYEPFTGIWSDKVIRSPRNKRTIYVPTPLGYVGENDGVDDMISKINSIGDEVLASLFYHPFREFKYITLGIGEDGYPTFSYSNNSNLHRIIEALQNNNYKLVKITNLKPKSSICEKMHQFFMKKD